MRRALPGLFVLAATLAVFAPTLGYGWATTWDDAVFIMGNPHVRSWEWVWMATTQWYGHWMPLTWLTFRANYAFFGDAPVSWHAVNLALHATSAVLLYCIARRLVGSTAGAVVAALVWALHPLRIESVAWLSERKDVVLGVFFLAAALLWMQGRRWWSFAAFCCACASKSPAVMLPVFLLLLEWYWRDAWLGYRLEGDRAWWRTPLRRLAPFFAVSVIVSVMAFFALHTALMSVPWAVVGLGPRLLHVAYSMVYYAAATVWPSRLSGLIEYTWVPSWDQPQYPLSVAVVVLAAVALLLLRRRAPALVACALAYAVAVLPQSGIFQNGPQLVGNRYSYLAALPLALLLGGAFTMASRRFALLAPALATGALSALIAVTLAALPMWTDGDAMWQYAALHEPTCTQCQDMASAADVRAHDYEAALAKQRRALAVSATTMYPRWERHWNIAALLIQLGREDEAAEALRTYLALAGEAVLSPPDHDHIMRARGVLALLEARR